MQEGKALVPVFNNMGITHYDMGQVGKAKEAFREGLSLLGGKEEYTLDPEEYTCLEGEEKGLAIDMLNNLGVMLEGEGSLPQAQAHY